MSLRNAKRRPWYRMKRVWLALIIMMGLVALSSCSGAAMLMKTAPTKPKSAAARPPLTAPNRPAWEAQIPQIKAALASDIYGAMPDDTAAEMTEARAINSAAFPTVSITEYTIKSETTPPFQMVLVLPKDAEDNTPIIMMENFCPNHNVIPADGISQPENIGFDCSGDGIMTNVFGYFFGRYITTPPITMIAARGYGLAVIYPPATFPDRASAVAQYRASAPDPSARWGAVAAWAHQFSLLTSALKADPRVGKVYSYGHSRYGKSALLAAAYDPRIDGVIAHQSGTGGASLTRGPDGTDDTKPGETRSAITQSYPHWFTPAYADATPALDQHHLLALIAPRPVLLGNAKRDVWSDPEGAFRAAQAASAVYDLYGSEGLRAERLTDFRPGDDLAFWMRPGTHGVVEEDWPAFLDFLEAQSGRD